MIDVSIDIEAGSLLLIDKPEGWTSFDVCKKIKGLLRRKYPKKKIKVGHGGTLDPLATGLLLVAIGKKTKMLHDIQGLDKSYDGIIKLGATTASYDRELEEENHQEYQEYSDEQIEQLRLQFVGPQEQIPPLYSAIKVDGQRAYAVARKGGHLEMKARSVNIMNFDFREINLPYLHFSVDVSKGTYIRSLAHDFGRELGCGGYLFMLRRTRIGKFELDNSVSLYELENYL